MEKSLSGKLARRISLRQLQVFEAVARHLSGDSCLVPAPSTDAGAVDGARTVHGEQVEDTKKV